MPVKVLTMYTTTFSFVPALKNSDFADENAEAKEFSDCILAFIQIEAEDEEKDVVYIVKTFTGTSFFVI